MLDILFIGCHHSIKIPLIEEQLIELPKHLQNIEYISSDQTRILSEVVYYTDSVINEGLSGKFILSFKDDMDKIKKIIDDGVTFIAITTRYYRNINQFRNIIQTLRSINRDLKFVVGGDFFINAYSKLTIKESQMLLTFIDADYYLLKDENCLEICNIIRNYKYNVRAFKNIIYKDNNKWIIANESENTVKYDPVICWERYADSVLDITAVSTMSSCPYDCSFCAVKNRTENYKLFPVNNVIDELIALKKIGKTSIINFTDETFNLPKKRFKCLLRDIIQREFNFKWYSFIRCEHLDDETVKLMKQSGCIAALIGFETGCDNLLLSMNKQTNTKDLIRGHNILKKHDIMTIGFYIVGFPGETKETINMTIDFINKEKPDLYKLHPWVCEMNTRIWDERDKYELIYKNGSWKHKTMEYSEAIQMIYYMKKSITNSINIDAADFTLAIQLKANGSDFNNIRKIYINNNGKDE